MTRRMFFYGTLMSGGPRGAIVERLGLRLVREAKIRGALFSVHDGYPALVAGAGEVLGEVWEAPDDETLRRALRTTDSIEGYREHSPQTSLYLRETVETLDGEPVLVYRWNEGTSDLREIPSGSWRADRAERQAREAARQATYGDDTWADAVWGSPAA